MIRRAATRLLLPALAVLVAWPQAPSAQPAPAASAAEAAAPPAAPASSAEATAPPAGPDPLQCSRLTDLASSADLKAAELQSRRADLAQLAQALEQAVGLWTQAVAACEGRARERARQNLGDTQHMRNEVAERQGAGEQCDRTQRNAGMLQDMATTAVSERRWRDASLLFRKAEAQWDLATERCAGNQRQVAQQRRDQVAEDGHNAEYCAPLFDRAREQTQRARNQAAASTPAERQKQSQIAETLWRDALAQCKGRAQELARANATAQAQERGTPWVATRPAENAPVPAPGLAAVAAAASAAPQGAPAPAPVAATAVAAAGRTAKTATAPPEPAVPAGPKPIDLRTEDGTRVSGQLTWSQATRTFSGNGRFEWPNGDVYEGDMVDGKRQGLGEFRSAAGEVYRGPWVGDKPHGRGHMRFANGNLYEGPMAEGLPEGEGSMIFASNDTYQGALRAGKPHGTGTYTWTNGQRCSCRWVDGEAVGPGTLRFPNGNLYEGELAAGKPHGQGRMVFASGDEYEGHFELGVLHGQGTYRWKNGDRYVGGWDGGRKEGQGTMTWANGDRWEGTYRADAQAEGVLKRKGG